MPMGPPGGKAEEDAFFQFQQIMKKTSFIKVSNHTIKWILTKGSHLSDDPILIFVL